MSRGLRRDGAASGRPRDVTLVDAMTGEETRAAPRVVVARPDHLGDLLLTLPAFAVLRRLLPEARLTCLAPPSLLPIAARARDVDEAIAMPLTMTDVVPTPDARVVAGAAAALAGRFDLALLPRPHDPWSGSLVAAAGVPIRVGHAQPGMERFLTHAYPERPVRHVARQGAVLAVRAASLLERPAVGRGRPARRTAAPTALLETLAEDEAEVSALLARLAAGAPPPVIVHPATGWRLKQWPVARWVEVVELLHRCRRGTILVVGGRGDRQLVQEIARASGGIARGVDDLSLGGLAALHRRAAVVVGIDSGALHLAALMGARVVSLYGPFGASRVGLLAPANRWRPLSIDLPCSPCGTLEQPPCGAVTEPLCLAGIDATAVEEAVAWLA